MGKNPYYPPIGNNIRYIYQATPSLKGTQTYATHSPFKQSIFSQKETDLGIGAATGKAPAGPSSFLFLLQRKTTSKACRPAQHQSRSGPTTPTCSSPVRLKKGIISGAVCGNDSSFTNKADHSVTDGINSEHKQEQRQSAKDTGSARRRRQQTSWHIRSDASQHERGGGAPPHQPMPDRRVRATHPADATPTGSTTDIGRSQHSPS